MKLGGTTAVSCCSTQAHGASLVLALGGFTTPTLHSKPAEPCRRTLGGMASMRIGVPGGGARERDSG